MAEQAKVTQEQKERLKELNGKPGPLSGEELKELSDLIKLHDNVADYVTWNDQLQGK